VFRRKNPLDLTAHIDVDEIATCLPIVQEVLQGFRDERAYRRAHSSMLAFPVVESPLEEEVFIHAAQLYRTSRQAGITVRSSFDCLIAACAIRHDLEVLHRDRDFDALARVSTLRQRTI
jgi:predicted nucleic acid-binding protein